MTTIYTIGHSNKSVDDLLSMLRENGIETVVDVRSAPYSRFAPQFNREPLSTALKGAGIEYRFAGKHLGGRPSDPTCYKSGQLPTGKADYLNEVDYAEVARRPWYRDAIDHLVKIAEERPTVIMCSEEDPVKCHRHHLIGKTLRERGIKVDHLPRREDAQMTLFDLGEFE
jgi:uncharacterized protein (DUF488 family)